MVRDTTRLAMDRQRVIIGSADADTAVEEAALLAEISESRRRLYSLG
jgi:hypothetical protein